MPELSKLTADVKAVMSAEGLSQSKAATQIGISASILSEWMKGSYKGDMEGVTIKVKRWLESRDTRAKYKSDLVRPKTFLKTQTAEVLKRVFSEAQEGPDIGLVTGDAGLGKTYAALNYAQNNPNVWVMSADPSIKTPRAALKEVCEVVGVQRTAGSMLFRSLVRRLEDTQGLLIIDEAQHLTTEAIDQLRTLHDRAEIGVVFVGNAPLKDRIEGFARLPSHAQLFSRIGFRANLKKPTKKDVSIILEAWDLKEKELLPVCEKIARCNGALRLMEKVLRYAAKIASSAQREAIQLKDIQESWADLTGIPFPKVGGAV